MKTRSLLGLAAASCLLLAGCVSVSTSSGPSQPGSARAAAAPRVRLTETNEVVRVELDGQLFTEYHFRDVTRPFLYPLLGAGNVPLTRHWPMENVPGEDHDHPHHRSFWFSHGDVNGVDLWSEEPKAGQTVHQKFLTQTSGNDRGILATSNEWRAKDGRVLGRDERRYTFYPPQGDVRIVDFEVTIFASAGEIVLGDTKEGTFALRVAESMRVMQPKNQPGQGRLVNSRGQLNGDVWGKRAEWADYSGPVDGHTVGIAILDHPSNPRHPTWWHARDYGLFAANPFGLHDFEKKEKGAGDMKIPAGGKVTFRYRVILHPGDEQVGRIASQFEEYKTIR